MAKEIVTTERYFGLHPSARLHYLANIYTPFTHPAIAEHMGEVTANLGLEFSPSELIIISALDHPHKVQTFLDTFIYYNYDHPVPGHKSSDVETALPPRQVLAQGKAHCFEGALFAYMVNYLHGYDPRLVLLESMLLDSDHNLTVWQNKITGLWGANGHSGYEGLGGRPAQYKTIQELAISYDRYYYHPVTDDPDDRTLVAYSHPFDLATFGTEWMDTQEPLWHIFENYVNETIAFSYLHGDPLETHMYPSFRALNNHWIRIGAASGIGYVSVEDLPQDAQELWKRFWEIYKNEPYPQGTAREIQDQFFAITGITPLDLMSMAAETT